MKITCFVSSSMVMCFATVVLAQSSASPNSPVNSPTIFTSEGRPIDKELSPETRQLLIGTKRLYEIPGLILSRVEIYKALGIDAEFAKRYMDTAGNRHLTERFLSRGPLLNSGWSGYLTYDDRNASNTWAVTVFLIYRGEACIPSRFVEELWGRPFIYQPSGTHQFLREMQRPPDVPPPTSHDGLPNNPGFSPLHSTSARVVLGIGRGACLSDITFGASFNPQEYSNDNVFYQ